MVHGMKKAHDVVQQNAKGEQQTSNNRETIKSCSEHASMHMYNLRPFDGSMGSAICIVYVPQA
jgi:hypothetical protein